MAGVFVVAVRAANADGTSAPVFFTLCIEASVTDPTGNVIDLVVDLSTREVGLLDALPGAADAALFLAKNRDDVMLRVRFRRNGIVVDLTLSALSFALKELEPEGILVASSDYFALGSGVFLIYGQLASDALTGALGNYETKKGDADTEFPALCEITWTAANAYTADIGPATLTQTSRTFRVELIRDLIL